MGAADGYGQEDQKLMATHANVATSLLEEQDQMVEAQRIHIDSMMKLVKEQMELLKKLDSDVVSVDEYVVALDQVLGKKQHRYPLSSSLPATSVSLSPIAPLSFAVGWLLLCFSLNEIRSRLVTFKAHLNQETQLSQSVKKIKGK